MNPFRPFLSGVLLLGSLLAQAPNTSVVAVKTRLQQLQKEQQILVTEWQKAAKEAAKLAEQEAQDGKSIKAISMRPDMGPLLAKFLAAAQEYSGDDQATLLVAAFRIASDQKARIEVLDLLLASHLKSKELAALGPMLGYLGAMCGPDYAKQALARIAKGSENPSVLAWIVYGEHNKTLETTAPSSPEFQQAKELLLAAAAKSGDADMQRRLKSTLTEKEAFGLGLVAPDIEGKDLDDVAFKLSDYRGKVVFLDYWGDW
jgi:hypothetical protein